MPPARAVNLWLFLSLSLACLLPGRPLSAQHRTAPAVSPTAISVSGPVSRTPSVSPPTLLPGPFSIAPENRSLLVFLGALGGAAVGAWLYSRELHRLNDGDFAAPVSIIVYVGGGALVGGGLTWLLLPRPAPDDADGNAGRHAGFPLRVAPRP